MLMHCLREHTLQLIPTCAPCSCLHQVGRHASEPDHRIFSASLDNTVRVWDPYDMACLNVLQGGTSEISAMLFFESWNLLVTGEYAAKVSSKSMIDRPI